MHEGYYTIDHGCGMGSRYGGLKQLDSVGPNQETIIDYSVYDAIRAGFNKLFLL